VSIKIINLFTTSMTCHSIFLVSCSEHILTSYATILIKYIVKNNSAGKSSFSN
jgi:hypothetical protein